MSIPCKSERSQLGHDEFEMVRVTHHPAIYGLAPDELRALKLRLRDHRSKARALASQKQREVRGKADPRGKSFPGTAELPRRRKQIFAAALAQFRAATFEHRPPPDATAHAGMRPGAAPSRRRTRLPPSRIGSISQATKVAQAIRDARKPSPST
jgi:hypothetical protein